MIQMLAFRSREKFNNLFYFKIFGAFLDNQSYKLQFDLGV